LFASAGHTVALKLEVAEVYIINTCSVTSYSDHKSRQAIAKAKKLNPNARIYVAGCSVEADKTQFQKDGITAICGTSGKQEFAERIIKDLVTTSQPIVTQEQIMPIPTTFEDPKSIYKGRKRGFVKIQDGCNNFCAYCIVPYLRGRSRSRSIESVIAEATKKAQTATEIVITGININDYGKDFEPQINLTRLIEKLKDVDAQKRISSISPRIITKDFLDICVCSNVIPAFHIALQSGSDKILKAMGRQYTVKEFVSAVTLIRSHYANPIITADIICGFPTETEDDHIATVNLLKELKLDDVHIFPFSVRSGTKAEKMDGKVEDKTITRRAKEMRLV